MSEQLTPEQVCEGLNEMKWRGREDWELTEYPHAVYWATWPVQDDGYNPYPEGIYESCESARAIVERADLGKRLRDTEAQLEAARQISGSFFDALKPLNLTAIDVENPGSHVTALIDELNRLAAIINGRTGLN